MEPNETTWTNMDSKGYQKGAKNSQMEPKPPKFFCMLKNLRKDNQIIKKQRCSEKVVSATPRVTRTTRPGLHFLDVCKTMIDFGSIWEPKTVNNDEKHNIHLYVKSRRKNNDGQEMKLRWSRSFMNTGTKMESKSNKNPAQRDSKTNANPKRLF